MSRDSETEGTVPFASFWQSGDENPAKLYLLGELTEVDHNRVDRWLMTASGAVEMIEEFEDQLVDDYLHGALSVAEQERFKDHFLITPERRAKLRLAQNLADLSSSASGTESERPHLWKSLIAAIRMQPWSVQAGLAAATIIVLLAATAVILQNIRLRDQLGDQEAVRTLPSRERELEEQLAQGQARNERLTDELQREKQKVTDLENSLAGLRDRGDVGNPTVSKLAIISLALSPGRLRDNEAANRVELPPGTDYLRLVLELETSDYTRYRALLQSADGKNLLQRTLRHSARNGEPLTFRVPARVVQAGELIVRVAGLTANGTSEDVGNYYFTAIKPARPH